MTNMLRSWEYKTKHQAVGDRVSAAGLVDADEEGDRALNALKAEIKRPKHIKPLKLFVPPHLEALHQSGIAVPIYLERLWPPEVWQIAEANNWLEEQEPFDFLSTELKDQIVRQEVVLTNIIDEDERLYVYNEPLAESKPEWVDYMVALNDGDLENHAASFLTLIDQVADHLGLQE